MQPKNEKAEFSTKFEDGKLEDRLNQQVNLEDTRRIMHQAFFKEGHPIDQTTGNGNLTWKVDLKGYHPSTEGVQSIGEAHRMQDMRELA